MKKAEIRYWFKRFQHLDTSNLDQPTKRKKTETPVSVFFSCFVRLFDTRENCSDFQCIIPDAPAQPVDRAVKIDAQRSGFRAVHP